MAGAAAQTRSRVARLRGLNIPRLLLAAAPAFSWAEAARAGPWIADSEEFAIASVATTPTRGAEADVYLERVLAPRKISLVVRAYTGDERAFQRQEADALVKLSATPAARFAVSGAAGPIFADGPEGACVGGGFETRLSVGVTLPAGSYLAGEGARRAFSGGCASFRSEATLGVTRGRWLAMAQVFTDREREETPAATAQLSVVRFARSRLGVQIGVRARLDSLGAAEPAIVIGVWAKGRPTG